MMEFVDIHRPDDGLADMAMDAPEVLDASSGLKQQSRDEFTAHVFSCIFAICCNEMRAHHLPLSHFIGLGHQDLEQLVAHWQPAGSELVDLRAEPEDCVFDEEEEQLHSLFLKHLGDNSRETLWLAAVLTRRSMSSNHLWQDLGLNTREELGRLMREHFPLLAVRNDKNMKWKKFFFRSLCELEGFTLCAAPSCDACEDFDNCFGDETGESRLARNRQADTPRTVRNGA